MTREERSRTAGCPIHRPTTPRTGLRPWGGEPALSLSNGSRPPRRRIWEFTQRRLSSRGAKRRKPALSEVEWGSAVVPHPNAYSHFSSVQGAPSISVMLSNRSASKACSERSRMGTCIHFSKNFGDAKRGRGLNKLSNASCIRARVYSCRNPQKTRPGFSPWRTLPVFWGTPPRGFHPAPLNSCHPERTGPQALFSLGVVSRRICSRF